jgi:hypothetical protein
LILERKRVKSSIKFLNFFVLKIMAQNEKRKYIPVKELGNLAKPDFCPRCFWYEKHFGPFPR